MNYLISSGWSTRFKSLAYKPTRDSWDTVQATIWHRDLTISAVRATYPRYLPVGLDKGFYVTDSEVRPAARLPGVVVAEVQLLGAFDFKIQGTGAASAHSESPSNILIPGLPGLQRNILFQKTDILVCEPTFEVMALDNVAPDLKGVARAS